MPLLLHLGPVPLLNLCKNIGSGQRQIPKIYARSHVPGLAKKLCLAEISMQGASIMILNHTLAFKDVGAGGYCVLGMGGTLLTSASMKKFVF